MLRLDSSNSLLLLIDMQEKLFPHMSNPEVLLTNTLKLVRGLNMLEVPIITTQQYTRGLGNTLQTIMDEFNPFQFSEKMHFSVWADSEIRTRIKALNKPNIILCGIEAHVCVLQTALDLVNAGYQTMVIADAIASRNDYNKQMAVQRMVQEGVRPATTESVLFEIIHVAGSEVFRNISKLVK